MGEFVSNWRDSMGGSKSTNLSGLGDFHLRSALKNVNPSVFNGRYGQYNERMSFQTYKRFFKDEDFISGYPCDLMMKYLQAAKENQSENLRFIGVQDDLRTFSQAVDNCISRTEMEFSTENIYFRFGDMPEQLEKMRWTSEYFTYRSVFSSIVVLMNSIASGRDLSPICEKKGIIMLSRGSHTSDSDGWLFAKKLLNEYLIITKELVFLRPYMDRERACQVPVWNVNAVRLTSDKLTERDIILRSCNYGSYVSPVIYPTVGSMRDLFNIGDNCIRKHSNSGYKFIKVYESLCVGFLLRKSRALISNRDEFWDNTKRDIIAENSDFKEYVDDLEELLESLPSNHHISQCYGLYRVWGHPSIDSKSGLKKVKTIGTVVKDTSETLSQLAGYHLLESIFYQFRIKKGRYPAMKELDAEAINSSYLLKKLSTNQVFNKKDNNYDIQDWEKVVADQTFSVPETFNLAMIIDDKAISPPRDFLIQVSQGLKKHTDLHERRGVLKFLSSETISCSGFLQDINDNSLDKNDCVIGLYPKERELNTTPRMFSLMSSKMRNYVVITEHMLADEILRFFPQITMTNDLLALTKKIYSATRTQERSGSSISEEERDSLEISGSLTKNIKYISVCVNMDFEKWNLNMRKGATLGVFTQLGRLFGMENLFNRTYDIFSESFIYVADDGAVLTSRKNSDGVYELIPDGINSYQGHIGGHEGLRQKGWTIFTVVIIKMICERHKISYKLMGQGDNQVLMLNLYSSKVDQKGHFTAEAISDMKATLNAIILDLDLTFRGLGLPLKTLESWKSESLFLYGKFPVLDGVPLSMSLKKICRCFPFSNDDNMTIDNMLGSVFTNAQAAAMSDITYHVPYRMSLIEGYLGIYEMLIYHPLIGCGVREILKKCLKWKVYVPEKKTEEEYRIVKVPSLHDISAAILLFPKSLSGSNGITAYEFVMRGFPDNQSRDLSYICSLMDNARKCSVKSKLSEKKNNLFSVCKNISKFIFSNDHSPTFLVEDPCGLNLLNPETPLSVLRKRVKRVMKDSNMVKNEDFKELFEIASESRTSDIESLFTQPITLFPRMLHDLYASTLYGYVDGIVSKVDKTSTVQKLSLGSSETDIMGEMMESEGNFLKFLIWRVCTYRETSLEKEPSHECPTNYVRWGRYFGWGKEILGVTVPFPGHLISESVCDTIRPRCPDNSFISGYISSNLPKSASALLNNIGENPPYLGSFTKEKIKTYEKAALYGSEPLLMKVTRALKVIGWSVSRDSNIHKFLKDVLSSLSDLDPEIFTTSDDQTTGSMEHRYKDSALKHGALITSLYTLGTWTHMSTDTLTDYSKGSGNVTLHFQAMLCWVQMILSGLIIKKIHENDASIAGSSYHFHLKCKKCIVPVQDDIPDIVSIPSEMIPRRENNPFCFVRNARLEWRDNSAFGAVQKLIVMSDVSIKDIFPQELRKLFHVHYALKISKDLLVRTEDVDNTAQASGLMDVGEYPRISFLKLNVSLTMSFTLFFSCIQILREWAESSRHESWSRESLIAELKGRLSKANSGSFLGLSTFYSWPEKLREFYSIPGMIIPRSYPISISDACSSAKANLLKYSETWDIESVMLPKFLNMSENSNPATNLLSFILRLHLTLSSNGQRWCQHCMKISMGEYARMLLGDQLPYKDKCSFFHRRLRLREIICGVKFVDISNDLIEKTLVMEKHPWLSDSKSRDFKQSLTMLRSQSIDFNLIKRKCNSNDKTMIQGIAFEEDFRNSDPNIQSSRLHRLIPFDESSCYRIAELIISPQFKKMQMRNIAVLGDGLGTTGVTLDQFFSTPLVAITQVSCDNAYPQTYPHSLPPCAVTYNTQDRIDYQLSKCFNFNIMDDKSIRKLNEAFMEKSCSSVVSEIELEHEGSYLDYSKLMSQIGKLASIRKCAVKLRLGREEAFNIFKLIIEDAYSTWDHCHIVITPFCNVPKKEFWLLAERDFLVYNRGVVCWSTFLRDNADSITQLKTHFESDLYEKEDLEKYFEEINNSMMNSTRILNSLNVTESFVQKIFPTYNIYKKISYSSLLYSILKHRLPKFIWDMGSRTSQYMHQDLEMSTFMMLTLLIIARSKSISVMKRFLMQIDSIRYYWVKRSSINAKIDGWFKCNMIISFQKLSFYRGVVFKEVCLSYKDLREIILRYAPIMIHCAPEVDQRLQMSHLSKLFVFGRESSVSKKTASGNFEVTQESMMEGSLLLRNILSANEEINYKRIELLNVTKTLKRKVFF